MKINFKTLKQESFELEIGETSSVKALKELLEKEKTIEIKSIKLILKGKILQDDQVISQLGMGEKDFIVLMVTKAAPPPSTPTTATTNTPTTATNPTAPVTSPVAPVPAPAPAPVAQGTAPADPAQSFTELATGNSYEMAVGNLVEMGFARDQVVLAMRAAFNNPDRAAEYLMTGIPESAQAPQTTPSTATAPAAQSPAPAPAAAQGQYTNLFQQAAALQQRPAAPTSTNADLESLRASPQFQQLRQMVQAQPHLLPAVLQQLQQTNPEIVQLISNNQDQFLQMLAEGQEGGEAQEVITITPEENEAVNRLVALGFERNLALEAYLACDKNEELAANYLFDMGGGDF